MKQNNNDHSDGKTLDIKDDLCWWKYITNNMKDRRYQGVIKNHKSQGETYKKRQIKNKENKHRNKRCPKDVQHTQSTTRIVYCFSGRVSSSFSAYVISHVIQGDGQSPLNVINEEKRWKENMTLSHQWNRCSIAIYKFTMATEFKTSIRLSWTPVRSLVVSSNPLSRKYMW